MYVSEQMEWVCRALWVHKDTNINKNVSEDTRLTHSLCSYFMMEMDEDHYERKWKNNYYFNEVIHIYFNVTSIYMQFNLSVWFLHNCWRCCTQRCRNNTAADGYVRTIKHTRGYKDIGLLKGNPFLFSCVREQRGLEILAAFYSREVNGTNKGIYWRLNS